MTLPFQPGERLFITSPLGIFLADFIEDDEGWAKLRFADDTTGTMRPSQVHHIDMLALNRALREYENSIIAGEHWATERQGTLVDEIAAHLGIEDTARIEHLHAQAESAFAI